MLMLSRLPAPLICSTAAANSSPHLTTPHDHTLLNFTLPYSTLLLFINPSSLSPPLPLTTPYLTIPHLTLPYLLCLPRILLQCLVSYLQHYNTFLQTAHFIFLPFLHLPSPHLHSPNCISFPSLPPPPHTPSPMKVYLLSHSFIHPLIHPLIHTYTHTYTLLILILYLYSYSTHTALYVTLTCPRWPYTVTLPSLFFQPPPPLPPIPHLPVYFHPLLLLIHPFVHPFILSFIHSFNFYSYYYLNYYYYYYYYYYFYYLPTNHLKRNQALSILSIA